MILHAEKRMSPFAAFPFAKQSSWARWLSWGLIAVLTCWLLGEMVLSTRWRMAHDQAPLFYEAYLMRALGRMPYRDFFDFQMPGTYLFYYLLGRASNFNEFRIRLIDLGLLLGLMAMTVRLMRPLGMQSAFLAAILFGLKYLQGGPSMALQREYLLLLGIVAALWLVGEERLPVRWRMFLAGMGVGVAVTIKPQAGIALPVLLAWLRFSDPLLLRRALLPLLGGVSLPIGGMLIGLLAGGLWSPFWEIVRHYWPLYAQINGEMEVVSGRERWLFILQQFPRLGGHGLWLLPAMLALGFSWKRLRSSTDFRLLTLLLISGIAWGFYPSFSGQFFDYHWLPFLYFLLLLASLAMEERLLQRGWLIGLFSLLLVIAWNVRPPTVVLRQLQGKPIAPLGGRVDTLAAFLENRLRAGDTVQPLDWTGGTLQAMLMSRATLATPFVFDFYFYHHVSHPYIQELRRRFMASMETHPPRFVIAIISEDKPWVSGPDTSREFPELQAFLEKNYLVRMQRKDYVIYEHR
jgi:hypothetical protein